eukprot:Transcript_20263.p1 GENE.Transcript_20263~~Transcript_20263.p1  ORF type:complete len:641 (+),score=165.34 Transcript_20263:1-1923(+)
MSLLRKPGKPKPSVKQPQQRGLLEFSSARSAAAGPSSGAPAPAPPPPPQISEALWVDKHAPRTSADLAIHKKKVEEVRDWLKRADASLQLGLPPTPRMLVLSGPTGSGKSAMLRVLADELHFEVCEWLEPRSDPWNRRFHPGDDNAAPYESRMTQFATFLHSSLRTLSLCLAPSGSSDATSDTNHGMRRRLVLLDELPNTAGGHHSDEQARQLQVLLRRALLVARFPIVLVLCTGAESSTSLPKQLETLLGPDAQSSFVSSVQVNPVADQFLTKAIKQIAAQERIDLPASALTSLVTKANGDLRGAVHALQYVSTGRTRQAAAPPASRSKKVLGKRALSDAASGSGVATKASEVGGDAERDRFLDLFQTIGSILNRPAKRAKAAAKAAEAQPAHWEQQQAQEQLPPQQPPAVMGARAPAAEGDGYDPEQKLQYSSLDDSMAAAFLQQNYLHFFADVDEVADAADFLSDAAVLADAQRVRPWQTPLLPYVSSLAARGVCTTNRHPAPSRFTGLTRPQFLVVDKAATERRQRALAAFMPSCDDHAHTLPEGILTSHAGQLTTEYAPLLRFMLAPACSPYASAQAQLHVGITGDQWQSVAELTNYGRGQEMPRYAPWSVLQSAPARAVTASTPTADIDEIEED